MEWLFAHIVLLAWLPISILAFLIAAPARAAAFVLLGGMLFLPEVARFDPPGLPMLKKTQISVLCLLVCTAIFAPGRFRELRRGWPLDALVVLMMIAAGVTVRNNHEILTYGPVSLPALRPHDTISMIASDVLGIALPLWLGRMWVRTRRDLEGLFTIIVKLGMVYSLFVLLESRLAPQLHRWIYGFDANYDFLQVMRWGGYRPTVFLKNGLVVAFWMFSVLLAMFAYRRQSKALWGLPTRWLMPYLGVVLVLCRSLGALLYTAISLPLIKLVRPRTTMRIFALLAVLASSYPAMRFSNLFPSQPLVEGATLISPERAESLAFRFENEETVLEKVRKKPWFGWGEFGRNRVFASWGDDITILDGFWVIRASVRGYVGLIVVWLLLLLPVMAAGRAARRLKDRDNQTMLAILTAIVTFSLVEWLPNDTGYAYPFYAAGILWRARQNMPAWEREAAAAARAAEAAAEYGQTSEAAPPPDRPFTTGS